MEEIMNYVMEQFGYLVSIDKDGSLYTYHELIEKLDCTDNEKRLIKLTFAAKNIVVRTIKKEQEEVITKEDRSSLVKDLEFGEKESFGLEPVDKPAIAKIEYEDEQLVYENYEELDDFIIHEFIPSKVVMKVLRSRNSKNIIEEKPYPSIRLCDIAALKLSDKEIEHVVKVIENEGVRIGGTSQDLENVSSTYDYVRTYKSSKYDKPLNKKELKEKLLIYYNYGDRLEKTDLEEELLIRNMRLIPYVAWKIAYNHNMEIEELISNGFEGLLHALRNYDPYMNASFATYAVPCIRGTILKYIPKDKQVPSYFYNSFNGVRYVVEKEWGKKFDGDPEMLREIFEIMESQGMASKGALITYYSALSNHESLEQMIEDDEDYLEDEKTVEEMVFPSFIRDHLNDAMRSLTTRENGILNMRYGLDGEGQKTLEEVGNVYNITKERVRQIECKALRKLRRPDNVQKIRPYMD